MFVTRSTYDNVAARLALAEERIQYLLRVNEELRKPPAEPPHFTLYLIPLRFRLVSVEYNAEEKITVVGLLFFESKELYEWSYPATPEQHAEFLRQFQENPEGPTFSSQAPNDTGTN